MFNEHSSTILNPVGNAMVLPPDKKPGTGRGMDLPIVYWDDFLTEGTGAWVESLSTSNTIDSIQTGVGGELHFDMGAGGLCGIQLRNAPFTCSAGKDAVFEARFRPTDASGTNVICGLATIDVSILTGVTDIIGFKVADGSASELIACVSGDQTTTTGVSIADSTNVVVRAEVTGVTSVAFYIDGNLVATHTAGTPVPTGAMTPSFEHTADADGDDLYLDYIYAALER